MNDTQQEHDIPKIRLAIFTTIYIIGIIAQLAVYITIAINGITGSLSQGIVSIILMIPLALIMLSSGSWWLPICARITGLPAK